MKRGLSVVNLDAGTTDPVADPVVSVQNSTKRSRSSRTSRAHTRQGSSQPPPMSRSTRDSVSESIDAVLNQSPSLINMADDFVSIDALRTEIRSLKQTVSNLTNHVNFLLSFFGISSPDPPKPGSADSPKLPNLVDSHLSSSTAPSIPPAVPGSSNHKGTLITDPPGPRLSSSLRQAVVSAVYTDLQSQARRATNIVVSGLPPVHSISDEQAVGQLIEGELHYRPTINKCRRLGKSIPGKTQPLLVTLKSDDQVEFIMAKAKTLRQSKVAAIRDHVFINRDMTRAQATAEYEARSRRRAERLARSARHPGRSPTAASTSLSGRQAPLPLSANAAPFVAASVELSTRRHVVDAMDTGTVTHQGQCSSLHQSQSLSLPPPPSTCTSTAATLPQQPFLAGSSGST
jgi:hypothetical protein